MAHHEAPHFHNDTGASSVHIGAKEFKCVGATPPFDHPHIYLDMGQEDEIVCPYCSTLYKFRADFKQTESDPANCYLANSA